MLDIFDPNTLDFNPPQLRMYAGSRADVECAVDEEDYFYFIQWLWKPIQNRNKLYFCRSITTQRSATTRQDATIYLHVEILKRAQGEAPTKRRRFADHWNGNSLDNRRRNLRWATRLENNRNRFGSSCQEEQECPI